MKRNQAGGGQVSATQFNWDACVAAFTGTRAEALAQWRGYTRGTVDFLHRQGLIGVYDDCYAFPVHQDGRVIGAHYRVRDRWKYSPGAKTAPLVIGELAKATRAHIFESQWDFFAICDAFGGDIGEDPAVISRGASNGAQAAKMIPEGVEEVLVWMQNDDAADRWLLTIAENTKATVLTVKTPAPHKDPNDWLQAGAKATDFIQAIAAAQTFASKPVGLPPMQDACAWLDEPDEEIPELIKDLVHQGMKFVVGGSSKSNKTWCLVDMAVSIATGADWWGFSTRKARVVYVNFEVAGVFFKKRIQAVCLAKGVALEPGALNVWNLRGHSANLEKLAPQIIKTVQTAGNVGLIILDPLYKLMAGKDENSAGDLGLLCNELDRLATQTGAAVAYGAHFSKGNQAAKESIDRISGSGVQARDPDSILTLTKHEEDGAFAVEPILRNHAPVEPFVVRWEYPLMSRADLDPAKLKQPGGRTAKYTIAQVMEPLDDGVSLSTGDWEAKVLKATGMSSRSFYNFKKEAEREGLAVLSASSGKWEAK